MDEIGANHQQTDGLAPGREAAYRAYLGRQPILNRAGAITAFELLFRSGAGNYADPCDSAQATAHVVARAIGEMGIAAALGEHDGYLNISRELLLDDIVHVIPVDRFVLEVPEPAAADTLVLERIQQLGALGYRFALDAVTSSSATLPALLPHVDIVKIDFLHCDRTRLDYLAGFLRGNKKTLLATKLETVADYTLARETGFDLFQGYFFAQPQILEGRRAPTSRRALLKLLHLLSGEPGIAALEAELKLNPTLVMHLMRLVNSGAFGLGRNVSSLKEAIIAIGTNRIARWTQLLLYADGRELPLASDPLVQMVASRARFMELASGRLRLTDRRITDAAFMTGVFSLVDVVFGAGLEETLNDLALAVPIRDAILRHAGVFGQLLRAVQASEQGDAATLDEACEKLVPLTPADLGEIQLAAAEWAALPNKT